MRTNGQATMALCPLFVLGMGAGACVTTGTHQAVLDELARTRQTLQAERDSALQKALQCEGDLNKSLEQNQQLLSRLVGVETVVETLTGETGSLSAEAARLRETKEQLQQRVNALNAMRAMAEKRNAEYQQVMGRLRELIDAGALKVSMRNGRMVVALSSDVIFSAGSVRVKPQAKEALLELAEALSGFADRRFQVVGHTDSRPISTGRYPSNWELSSQRAIEVVKLLVEAGVPPSILSASGSAEFDPIASNAFPEDRAMNRRVEVVFVPKIAELVSADPSLVPGLDSSAILTTSNPPLDPPLAPLPPPDGTQAPVPAESPAQQPEKKESTDPIPSASNYVHDGNEDASSAHPPSASRF